MVAFGSLEESLSSSSEKLIFGEGRGGGGHSGFIHLNLLQLVRMLLLLKHCQ